MQCVVSKIVPSRLPKARQVALDRFFSGPKPATDPEEGASLEHATKAKAKAKAKGSALGRLAKSQKKGRAATRAVLATAMGRGKGKGASGSKRKASEETAALADEGNAGAPRPPTPAAAANSMLVPWFPPPLSPAAAQGTGSTSGSKRKASKAAASPSLPAPAAAAVSGATHSLSQATEPFEEEILSSSPPTPTSGSDLDSEAAAPPPPPPPPPAPAAAQGTGTRRGPRRQASEAAASASLAVAPGLRRLGHIADPPAEVPARPRIEAEVDFPEVKSVYRCNRCGGQLDKAKLLCTGKHSGVYRCSKCNSKGVALYRLPGWKPFQAQLRAFSPEQRQQFWQGTHALNGPKLNEFLQEKSTLTTSFTQSEQAVVGGEYLPLSVYEKRGFCVDDIVSKCKDWYDDEVLGRVYRVSIRSGARTANHERQFSNILSKTLSSRAAEPGVPDPAPAPAPGTPAPPAPPQPEKPTARQLQASQQMAGKVLSKLGVVSVPLQATPALRPDRTRPDPSRLDPTRPPTRLARSSR